MKKILVTGGAGFIGSHVVRLFVNKYPDYKIVNLDKLTYAGNLNNLKDIEIIETIFPEIVKFWENGDAKNLALIINKSLMEYPAIHERFIIKRNNNWLSMIASFLRQNKKNRRNRRRNPITKSLC